MIARVPVTLACIALLAPGSIYAQAGDMAAERARIANQRIQAESERRAEEEEERLRQAETPAGAAVETTAETRAVQPSPPSASEPRPAASTAPVSEVRPARSTAPGADMERVLEQLRELGGLKDAGYVTDEEFERIKQRILEQSL